MVSVCVSIFRYLSAGLHCQGAVALHQRFQTTQLPIILAAVSQSEVKELAEVSREVCRSLVMKSTATWPGLGRKLAEHQEVVARKTELSE